MFHFQMLKKKFHCGRVGRESVWYEDAHAQQQLWGKHNNTTQQRQQPYCTKGAGGGDCDAERASECDAQ